MQLNPIHEIAIALGLGLLVGLQREWAKNTVAGIRTFPLITVLGVVCALLSNRFGGWIVVAGLLGVAAVVLVGSIAGMHAGNRSAGVTTEVTALLMYAVGTMIASDLLVPALVVGGGAAVLLHWKHPLHELVYKIGDADVRAVMRFSLIALVIWPVLPDHSYGPFGVLNPFRIWLMVVLIVGITLGAYVAFRLFGARRGAVLAGVLGGLISSTACTISASRESRTDPARSAAGALVIVLASGTVFFRVLTEIAVATPSVAPHLAPPLAAMAGLTVLIGAASFLAMQRWVAAAPATAQAPAGLTTAIAFGLLYTAVAFGISYAKRGFGDSGLYAVAALSGVTDMDAITLSTSQLVANDKLVAGTGWRLILVGSMANIVFKGAVTIVLGSRRLWLYTGIPFLAMLLGAGTILVLWPA